MIELNYFWYYTSFGFKTEVIFRSKVITLDQLEQVDSDILFINPNRGRSLSSSSSKEVLVHIVLTSL